MVLEFWESVTTISGLEHYRDWEIGALFSALEPVPLVAMFVHVMYDWGKEQGLQKAQHGKAQMNNTPAFLWNVLYK